MGIFSGLFGGGPKPPKLPDSIGLAKQDAAANLNLARVNTQSNRINQFTPFGSQVFTHNGDNWTSTEKLSPAQQAQLNQQNTALNSLGKQSIRQASHPFDYNNLPARQINAGQTAQDAILSRLEPQFARDEESLRSRLINQGLTPGSDASNAEMQNFNQGRTDARMQAALQGMGIGESERNQAFGEQAFTRAEPINLLGAMRTGGQVQMPNFMQAGQQPLTPGANLSGAAQNQYSGQLGNYNAKQAQQGNMMNGLFSAGASALPFLMASDRRLKSNIVRIGEYNGHNLYEYDIFGERRQGVMAQEVIKTRPDAVHRHESGYLMVDYNAL